MGSVSHKSCIRFLCCLVLLRFYHQLSVHHMIYRQISNISRTLIVYYLHCLLNIWLQWIGLRQEQDETRIIYVLGFGASYIRGFTVTIHIPCDCFTGCGTMTRAMMYHVCWYFSEQWHQTIRNMLHLLLLPPDYTGLYCQGKLKENASVLLMLFLLLNFVNSLGGQIVKWHCTKSVKMLLV